MVRISLISDGNHVVSLAPQTTVVVQSAWGHLSWMGGAAIMYFN